MRLNTLISIASIIIEMNSLDIAVSEGRGIQLTFEENADALVRQKSS
jgi:hypothetical protein